MDQITGKDAELSRWPKDIFAITLFVEDLQATKQFYLRVFGLPVDYEDDNSAVFKFGNTLINLLKTTAAVELVEPATVARREAGSRMVFTLHVDDVDAMCAVAVLGPMQSPIGNLASEHRRTRALAAFGIRPRAEH